MAEGETFIDRALEDHIGTLTPTVQRAIDQEVCDALEAVLSGFLIDRADARLHASRLAPWAYDLARGMQWHASLGTAETSAESLILQLSAKSLDARACANYASSLDVAWALLHGRVVEQIFGRGALELPSAALRARYPWLDATTLGCRIGLALDLLRLMETT